MADVSHELQAAIHTALSADVDLTALVGTRIYDIIDEGDVAYPCIVVDGDDLSEEGTKSGLKYEHMITFHVWSDTGSSRKQARDIASKIVGVLHNNNLALAGGFNLVNLRHISTNTVPDVDEKMVQAIVRFRAFTE